LKNYNGGGENFLTQTTQFIKSNQLEVE